MAEILELVDLEALRREVREKYRDVAADPTAVGTLGYSIRARRPK